MGKIVYRFTDFSSSDLPKVDTGAQLWTYVSPDSASYLLHTDKGKWLAGTLRFDERIKWFDTPFSFLPDVLKDEKLMFSHFGQSRFAVRGIPFEIARADSPVKIAVGANDDLRQDELGTSTQVLRYGIPKVFAKDLSEYYSNASIKHSISVLINDALNQDHHEGSHFYLVLSEGIMEIVAVSDNELVFANHYPWQTEADILYYGSAVMDMLGADDWTPHVSGMSCNAEREARLVSELFPSVDYAGHDDEEIKLNPLIKFSRCAS